MSDMGRLAQLATDPRDRASRAEIYLAVASLYRVQGAELNLRERDLSRDILRRLTRDVEMAIRIALAERLADDIDAPHDLILLLVDDCIEVARPLILRSPLLVEHDLLRLIAKEAPGYREAVANRPYIGPALTEALVRCREESVLVALARNATAKISDDAYAALVEHSRSCSGLAEPLVRRSDLPVALANKMTGWVSAALKSYIRANYRIAHGQLEKAMSQAVETLAGVRHAESTDSAQNLVDKLAVSGQLKAGFLIRVLSQGQIDLFEQGFARLLEMDRPVFCRFFYDTSVMVLCCRAAGIDQAVFPTVFNLAHQARNRKVSLSPACKQEAEGIFARFTRAEAIKELRTLTAG
ncbi:MAG: DUF2336 domain-containing protein [Rhizomicrobium sp.]